jgi:predicted ATPase
MNKLDIEVKNLGKFKGGTIKVRPLTVLTGENGTGKSFFTKTLYSVFSIVNKNLLYIEAVGNIHASNLGVDVLENSLTHKGKEDKKHIQSLRSDLNELHTLLIDMKDYPIDAYIQTCSVANNTQIKSIHKFTEYLEELEKKQKPEPVHRVANFLKKYLTSLTLEMR